MAIYEIWTVDAFTTERFAGNPCAVVPDARGLDDRAMLRIAREMNISETAFVFPSERADIAVRYFTPVEEIPLAGHPTVATAHVLRELGRIRDGQCMFEMAVGLIPVAVAKDGATFRYTMTQPAPSFLRTYPAKTAAHWLGLSEGDVCANVPAQTVSTGTTVLLVALTSLGALDRMEPDRRAMYRLPERDFFTAHCFVRTPHAAYGFETRNISDYGDVLEDPVTGSGCGALAAFAWQHGLIDRPDFTIAQGRHVGRPGTVYASVIGSREHIEGVRIGGHAVTMLKGALTV